MQTHYTIGGHSFSTYWSIFFLGFFFMLILNVVRGKKRGMKWRVSGALTIAVVAVSFLGAKILYYLENPSVLAGSGVKLGGVSFFGSVFLVPAVMLLLCRIRKLSYGRIMDFLSPSLMLMLATLRVGCWVSGCCGGISLVCAGVYVEKFPTQITECVCDLLIMGGLLFYERFWENEGRLYFFIMVYYGVVRFFLEFVRDTPKDWLGLSHGQWFAAFSVCIGGYMLARLGKLEKKKKKRGGRR